MMLSIFKGYADTVPVSVTLDEVVRLIREDKLRPTAPKNTVTTARRGRRQLPVGKRLPALALP